ncbi:carbon-nitrogen hydrolase family protein [Kitasatospora sp. NPDC058190]|uniref:carbon-nitrogen hydrolase family protein n=1 Tax=Kitasatospora sp. NPDC058190 TaxID=3346371 RepID=UPI0036DF9864
MTRAAPDPLPSEGLRVAALQARAIPGEVAANGASAAALVSRAAAEGARVAILPELHLPGYHLAGLCTDPRAEVSADEAGQVSDPRLDPLRSSARSGVTIVVGAAVRRPDRSLTNSLLAVTPAGDVSVAYDKQHLWHSDEAALFRPGTRTRTLDIGGWKLGLAICYDMSFPEHARAAAVTGAHAYLCPSAFATGREHRAHVYLAARALENTVYSMFVNSVGGPADRPCDGGSVVYGPDGSSLATARGASEQTLVTDFTPTALAQTRKFLRMLSEYRSA